MRACIIAIATFLISACSPCDGADVEIEGFCVFKNRHHVPDLLLANTLQNLQELHNETNPQIDISGMASREPIRIEIVEPGGLGPGIRGKQSYKRLYIEYPPEPGFCPDFMQTIAHEILHALEQFELGRSLAERHAHATSDYFRQTHGPESLEIKVYKAAIDHCQVWSL